MAQNNLHPFERHTAQTVEISRTAGCAVLVEGDTIPTELYDPASNNPIAVLFSIRGLTERLMLRPHTPVKLGRFEPIDRQMDEMDLTAYGAADRGVSRLHAAIHLEANQVFITDLNSINGTSLGGVKLVPGCATLLPSGSKVTLGRLLIQVNFR